MNRLLGLDQKMQPLYDIHPLLKAVQLIVLVTFFSGTMHIVRLFVAHRDGFAKWEPDRKILSDQFVLMEKRALYYWIWPSLVVLMALGIWMIYSRPGLLREPFMQVGLGLIALMLGYQLLVQRIYGQLKRGEMKWSGFQLHLWSQGPTVLLYALILLLLMRDELTWIWGIGGLVVLGGIIMYVIASVRKK